MGKRRQYILQLICTVKQKPSGSLILRCDDSSRPSAARTLWELCRQGVFMYRSRQTSLYRREEANVSSVTNFSRTTSHRACSCVCRRYCLDRSSGPRAGQHAEIVGTACQLTGERGGL